METFEEGTNASSDVAGAARPRMAYRLSRPSMRDGRYALRAHGVSVFGSSFAAQSPLLKSVKRMCPFHGIAFITKGAFGV